MPRSKKTRKIGQIGVRKSDSAPKKKRTEIAKPKKKTGRPAGSRHNVENTKPSQPTDAKRQDPRIGSKKPVALIVAETPQKVARKKTFFSPAQELEAIENDTRLQDLLDQQDAGKTLTKEQQQYVDSKLARHSVLCELLGIEDEDDNDDDDELLDELDTRHLDQYKP